MEMRASTLFVLSVIAVFAIADYWLLTRDVAAVDMTLVPKSRRVASSGVLKEIGSQPKLGSPTGPVHPGRSLFVSANAGRSSLEASEQKKKQGNKADDALELKGIILKKGIQLAFVFSNKPNSLLRLKLGDKAGPWRLESIEPTRAVFRDGLRIKILSLKTSPQVLSERSSKVSGTKKKRLSIGEKR